MLGTRVEDLDAATRQEQETRREALNAARDAMRLGKQLADERDSNKRSYYEMNPVGQKCLERYDTRKSKLDKEAHSIKRQKIFRSTM